jgi:hypothetical protein
MVPCLTAPVNDTHCCILLQEEDAVEVKQIPAPNFSWVTALQNVYKISTALSTSIGATQDAHVPDLGSRYNGGELANLAALLALPQLANARSIVEGGAGLRMEATGIHFPWD